MSNNDSINYKDEYDTLKAKFDDLQDKHNNLQAKYTGLEDNYNSYKFDTEFEADIVSKDLGHISSEDKEILKELKKNGNEKLYENYSKLLAKPGFKIGGNGSAEGSYISSSSGFSKAISELREGRK